MGKETKSPARFASARTETLVHSTPRKKRQRTAAGTDTKRPTHSQMGNPYPDGLEPVVVEYAVPGARDGRRPFDEASIPGPGEGLVVTDEYLSQTLHEAWPRLKLRLKPQRPDETAAQYASYRADIERNTAAHIFGLYICQKLCTFLENFLTCPQGECRRRGICCGMRDEERYWLPILIYPPCVPLDLEITETYRQEIGATFKRLKAGREAPPPLRARQRPHN
jgi:hypothetical protein